MFGKDAKCSSVEATSLLFSVGAEPRRPGLCAQRSCTPLLYKLNADRMSPWRTGRRPVFRAASGKASWEVDCLSQSFSALQAGSLRSLDFVRD